jgi:hypothetical protein
VRGELGSIAVRDRHLIAHWFMGRAGRGAHGMEPRDERLVHHKDLRLA